MADAAVRGSVTIPGRPEQVRAARAFVARTLGALHPSLPDAVLLTSELVTNALVHSKSGLPGGTISVLVAEAAGGVRIEVIDAGSDLKVPVVRGEPHAAAGRGLFLVQALADQWGYGRTDAGTTVWFWLAGG
jgi:anti-sigma regulatory factor (Ser/Thr protein kinase)